MLIMFFTVFIVVNLLYKIRNAFFFWTNVSENNVKNVFRKEKKHLFGFMR